MCFLFNSRVVPQFRMVSQVSKAYIFVFHGTYHLFRPQEDSLSVWNRTATDMTSTTRIRDTLRRILNIPLTTAMEYKIHCDSLKYVSM